MTDSPPPPPPGFPPMPPPPPPPGIRDNDEDKISEVEDESTIDENPNPPATSLPEEHESESISPDADLDSPPLPTPPLTFDIPIAPPPPPGLQLEDVDNSESEEVEDVSLEDSLAVFSAAESLDGNVWPESFQPDSVSNIDSISYDASEASELQTDESLPLHPSNLRSAVEVDKIPGDKLYVTLREKEESVLNSDGTVRQQSIDGELVLRNSSRKDRAWDIEVNLQNTGSTDIGGGAITVRELDATESTTLPYTASGPRMMVVREHIDTEPERSQEPSLSMVFSPNSQEIMIRLSVENIAPIALNDVEIRRAIPDNFDISDGPEYDIKDSELIWKIGRLSVGETSSLTINPRITTRSIQRFATGVVRATYSSESTVSRIQFESVKSRARQFGYVSPKEDDRPDVFHCKLVVENRSSFVVSLSGATVWLAGRSDPFLEMDDIREDIPPEGLWDSLEKRIETIDKPNFTHEIDYSILTRANVES
ncbi:MAG: hypothetical protein QF635_01295, partial [Candidatus Thalassarchaeaceae archaeon]|nr:hypothetical protein [Candidatus Thalassarchaeaceae archaeon]